MAHQGPTWTDAMLAQLRTMFAAGVVDYDIAKALDISADAVGYRRRKLGMTRDVIFRPMPSDFREVGPTLTRQRAAAHYKTSWQVIQRWHAEAGTTSSPRTFARQEPPPKPVEIKRPLKANPWHKPFATPQVPANDVEQAAHFLRRTFAPVHRLTTIEPKASPTLWVVGRERIEAIEVVERARRKGWAA